MPLEHVVIGRIYQAFLSEPLNCKLYLLWFLIVRKAKNSFFMVQWHFERNKCITCIPTSQPREWTACVWINYHTPGPLNVSILASFHSQSPMNFPFSLLYSGTHPRLCFLPCLEICWCHIRWSEDVCMWLSSIGCLSHKLSSFMLFPKTEGTGPLK